MVLSYDEGKRLASVSVVLGQQTGKGVIRLLTVTGGYAQKQEQLRYLRTRGIKLLRIGSRAVQSTYT